MQLGEYLDSCKAENHGYYFIVNCPVCGRKEAYIYTADIERHNKQKDFKIPIRCNRLNKCGATSYIEEEITIDEKLLKQAKNTEEIQITKEGIDLLETLCKMANLLPEFNFRLRGIKNETLKKYGIVYLKNGWADFVMKKQSKFHKRYWGKNYQDRDILIPINNLDGKLDRLLLRSKDKKLEKKEIQVKLRKNATEVWNARDIVDENKKVIFFTEGVYDALSIADCAGKYEDVLGIASIPGVKKYRKIIEIIKANQKKCIGKTFVVAFDSDLGGQENLEKMIEGLKKIGMKYEIFDLAGYKDANDFLCSNRFVFGIKVRKTVRKIIEETNEKKKEQRLN